MENQINQNQNQELQQQLEKLEIADQKPIKQEDNNQQIQSDIQYNANNIHNEIPDEELKKN